MNILNRQQSTLFFVLCAVAYVACALHRPVFASTGPYTSLDSILRVNLEAQRPAGTTVHSTDKTVRIEEAGFSVIGRYRASADGRMRIDIFADGQRVYSEGLDAQGAWEWPGGHDEPYEVGRDAAGPLEHGIEFNLFPLAAFGDRGHDIELAGTESIDGSDYHVLMVTMADGFETYRYVNAATGLIEISRDFRALHPAIDATSKNMETRYDRWQQDGGPVYASRSRVYDRATGELVQTAEVLQSQYNLAASELDLERTYVPASSPQ